MFPVPFLIFVITWLKEHFTDCCDLRYKDDKLFITNVESVSVVNLTCPVVSISFIVLSVMFLQVELHAKMHTLTELVI